MTATRRRTKTTAARRRVKTTDTTQRRAKTTATRRCTKTTATLHEDHRHAAPRDAARRQPPPNDNADGWREDPDGIVEVTSRDDGGGNNEVTG
jgi:hypothetical protein